MLTTTSGYDEALERFHCTGPEREGWLSNHGPMVVEALEQLGQDDRVHAWSDRYLPRLARGRAARYRADRGRGLA